MSKLTSTIISNIALAMVLWLAPASAQQQEPSSELDAAGDRPWARGVPLERQEAALKLFLEGNKLIKQSAFVQAAEKYNAALKHWDHPGIHYNLALALTPLRQPLEVHRHLEAAMSHGPEALDAQKYEFARTHKDLVRQQLAWVEITCDKPGAKVTMDGKLLFVAPGRYEGLALPGQHSIVAALEDYEPTERSRLLQAGEGASIDLKLYKTAELTRHKRRWQEWIPWTVIGAGVAISAGGGLFHLQARDSFNAFDAHATDCYQQAKQDDPCMMNDRLAGQLNLGNTQQNLAVGSYSVGGAAVVAGMVMLYLNSSQSYRISPEQLEQERQGQAGGGLEKRVSVVPLLGGGVGGIMAAFRF